MLNLDKNHDSTANFASKATSLSNVAIEWVLDSGASDHVMCVEKAPTSPKPVSHFLPIKIPNGSFLPAKSSGDVSLNSLVTLKNASI